MRVRVRLRVCVHFEQSSIMCYASEAESRTFRVAPLERTCTRVWYGVLLSSS